MGFKTWTSETLTASDLNNYLMKQANIATTVGSEPTGVEGMEVHLTDRDQVRIYSGSAWIRTAWWSSSGRTGCALVRNSAVGVSNATLTAIPWDVESADTDGFYAPSGGTITIPTGCGGLYMAMVGVDFQAGIGTLGGKINMTRNGTTIYEHTMPADLGSDCASFSPVVLAAGDTVTFPVLQTSGGSLNMTARLEFYRIGA